MPLPRNVPHPSGAAKEGQSLSVNPPSAEKLSIARANWDDMPTVASFIRSSKEWYRPIIDEKDMAEHEVGHDWMEKNFKKREFYLGSAGDTPVGTISLQNVGGFTYLGYIYLDVAHVGKRYGHQLVEFAKKKSRESDRKGMFLIAHPKASWSVKAYLKMGFKMIASKKEDVLAWNNGALVPYYEEGFELYVYQL